MNRKIEENTAAGPPPVARRSRFSIIIGERHSNDVHHIVEYITAANVYMGTSKRYRLRTVSYQYFREHRGRRGIAGGQLAGQAAAACAGVGGYPRRRALQSMEQRGKGRAV